MGRPGLSLDKKFRRLAHDLDDFQAGFGRVLARGSLELLWDTAYEACTDEMGDAFDVEAAAEWRGPPGRLVKALAEAGGVGNAGFIEEGGSPFWPEGAPGTYRVHDLWDHAPDYARKRAEREEEREKKGKTIKALRAEAGRKGAARTNSKRAANVQLTDGNRPANVPTLADEPAATVSTLAGTPAPAPAPALATTPRRRVGIGGNPLTVEASPGSPERWPRTAAVLAALWERKVDALWPAEADTTDRIERALAAFDTTQAADRLASSLAADPAHPWLGWHVEALRAERRPKVGDLGADLGAPWHKRLTHEEFQSFVAERHEIAPEMDDAPPSAVGPERELVHLVDKYRAIAEGRR